MGIPYRVERVVAKGHPNIRGLHRTTIEITREEELTPRGDCIIGVGADKAAAHLDPEFKGLLARDTSVLVAILEAGGYRDIVLAQGSSRLILGDDDKMILRRSSYIEPATIGVRANKAARDIDRRLIDILRDPSATLRITLIALDLNEIHPVNEEAWPIV